LRHKLRLWLQVNRNQERTTTGCTQKALTLPLEIDVPDLIELETELMEPEVILKKAIVVPWTQSLVRVVDGTTSIEGEKH